MRFNKSFVFVYYSLILLTVILVSTSLADNKFRTIITSVNVAGAEIPESAWNNIEIKPAQTITVSYKAEGNNVETSKILFKTFLNGKLYEIESHTPLDKNITLGQLNEGIYIVRIQAYNEKAMEAVPAALKFMVSNSIAATGTSNSAIKTSEAAADNNGSAYLLYGVILICAIQLIIISIFIMRRRASGSSQAGIDLQDKSGNIESDRLRQENERLRKDNDLLKSYNTLNAEFVDLEYSYEKLKKEYSSLKEANDFLKQQVNSLRANISDLETANAQLAIQKDKLLENKRQLEELQAQKDELFAIAVHDIKNPASAIRSYVELLDSYDLNAQEQQEVMQSLIDTSSHIIDLAHQMSLVVIKKKPEPMLKFEQGSIKKIADSVCNRNLGYSIKKGIKLINQTSPNTPDTNMDVSKIEEVLDNLVNNAIKYAPKGTVVQVKSYFSDSKITVEVIDNGVGLSEEDCRHAFKKGVLLTPKPTDGETRSGLGLWIVKKIIEDHGGNVWVRSKLGVGSTFAFDMPIKK